MSSFERRMNRPRDTIATSEYTPLRSKDGSYRFFIPSISVVKSCRPEDIKAQVFAKHVSKLLRNQNRNKRKVSATFNVPFHTRMETVLVNQKRLADANEAIGYKPRIELMRDVGLLLRSELEERYRNKPGLQVYRPGDLAIDTNGNRDKLVLLTADKKDLTERRFCAQFITENLPNRVKIDPWEIQGDPGVTIGSVSEKDQQITKDDYEVLDPLIGEVKPSRLIMATAVIVHSGLGRSGIDIYPVEP